MPGALPDILSCDDKSIYMRHARFDMTCRPQSPDVAHLFSAAGFLDDTWWHRTYWMVGTVMATNYGGWPRAGNQVPAGRLLAVGDSTVYGFGRNQYIHHGTHVGIDGASIFHFKPDRDGQRRFTYYQAFAINRDIPRRKKQRAKAAKKYQWTRQLPLLARTLVLSKDTLFMAGTPDIFSSDDPIAALEGNKGGLLCALSAADGNKLAQYNLESPPVFDGMAVAGGRLYMATLDGNILCFRGNK